MQDMSPEDMQALVGTMNDPSKLADIQNQLESARRLRDPNSAATTTAPGGLQFANVGGIAADVLDHYRGQRDENTLMGKQSDIYKNQQTQVMNYLNKVKGFGNTATTPNTSPGNYSFQ